MWNSPIITEISVGWHYHYHILQYIQYTITLFNIVNIFFVLLPWRICRLSRSCNCWSVGPTRTSDDKGSRMSHVAYITYGRWDRRLIISGIINNSFHISVWRTFARRYTQKRNTQDAISEEPALRQWEPCPKLAWTLHGHSEKYRRKKREEAGNCPFVLHGTVSEHETTQKL